MPAALPTADFLARTAPAVLDYESRVQTEGGPLPPGPPVPGSPKRFVLFEDLHGGPGTTDRGGSAATVVKAAELGADDGGPAFWVELLGLHRTVGQGAAEASLTVAGPDGTSDPFAPSANARTFRAACEAAGVSASTWFGGVVHEGRKYDLGRWLIRPDAEAAGDAAGLRIRELTGGDFAVARVVPTFDRPTGAVRELRCPFPTETPFTRYTAGSVVVARNFGGNWWVLGGQTHWYAGDDPRDALPGEA